MNKTILVRACRQAVDYANGWDAEETHLETLKEAKLRAKYMLTEEYRLACEASERLVYSQVVVYAKGEANGEVLYDYFGK